VRRESGPRWLRLRFLRVGMVQILAGRVILERKVRAFVTLH
jgi:hypothetical protein